MTEFGERRLDLLVGRKVLLGGVAQAAVDAGQFSRCRLVLTFAQAFVDVARDLGQFVLRISGSGIDAFEGLGQALGTHGLIIAVFRWVGKAQRAR